MSNTDTIPSSDFNTCPAVVEVCIPAFNAGGGESIPAELHIYGQEIQCRIEILDRLVAAGFVADDYYQQELDVIVKATARFPSEQIAVKAALDAGAGDCFMEWNGEDGHLIVDERDADLRASGVAL